MIAALALLVGSCLAPPVAGPIVVPYRAPACSYCSGHRGVEYAPLPGTPVHAVQAGTVSFAGRVAGVTYVVILQPDGLKATYGYLRAPLVRAGSMVAQGQVVGLSSARLYFGWRRGDTPVDPTRTLGRWSSRVRLVPTDGGPAPPSVRRLECSNAT